MPTVSELDEKLEDLKRQTLRVKEQRKEAVRKEREQARKWRAMTLTAIGEAVASSLGTPWTDIDLESLREWLDANADALRQFAVTEHRTPAKAKEALDAFKRPVRKQEPPADTEPESDTADSPETEPVGQEGVW